MYRGLSTYDKQGVTAESTAYTADGAMQGRSVSRHDARGHQREGASYDGSGGLMAKDVYTTEVDEHGNWVKLTTSRVNLAKGKDAPPIPAEALFRSITYLTQPSPSAPSAATSEEPQPAPKKPPKSRRR